jgi:protein subunit release factor A
MNEEDLRVDTYSAAVPNSEVVIRVTHMPTGLFIEDKGYRRITLKNALVERLRQKVEQNR